MIDSKKIFVTYTANKDNIYNIKSFYKSIGTFLKKKKAQNEQKITSRLFTEEMLIANTHSSPSCTQKKIHIN